MAGKLFNSLCGEGVVDDGRLSSHWRGKVKVATSLGPLRRHLGICAKAIDSNCFLAPTLDYPEMHTELSGVRRGCSVVVTISTH